MKKVDGAGTDATQEANLCRDTQGVKNRGLIVAPPKIAHYEKITKMRGITASFWVHCSNLPKFSGALGSKRLGTPV